MRKVEKVSHCRYLTIMLHQNLGLYKDIERSVAFLDTIQNTNTRLMMCITKLQFSGLRQYRHLIVFTSFDV